MSPEEIAATPPMVPEGLTAATGGATDIRNFTHQVLTAGIHAAQASTLAGVAISEQPSHWVDHWFKPQDRGRGTRLTSTQKPPWRKAAFEKIHY